MNQPAKIIAYREFYDVPRIFIAELGSAWYLFDCPFDDQIDDYASTYTVYEFPKMEKSALTGSWENFPAQAIRKIGSVLVTHVKFDQTLRREIESAVIEHLAH